MLRNRLFASLCLWLGAASCLWAQPDNPGVNEKTRLVVRSHTGDDVRWANSAFDDREWPVMQHQPLIVEGWTWYRMRMQLPADHHAMEVGINAPVNSFEAYVDGRRMEGYEIHSWLKMACEHEFAIPLPQRDGTVEVAFRVFMPRLIAPYFLPRIVFRFETPETAAVRIDNNNVREMMYSLPNVMINLVIVLGGMGILVLYASNRSHQEYLWAGLFLTAMGASSVAGRVSVVVSAVPYWVNIFIADTLAYLLMFFQIEFTFEFLRRPVNGIWRILEYALLLGFILEMAWSAGLVSQQAFQIGDGFLFLVPAFGLPMLLLVHFRRGSAEAGLLLLPSFLSAMSIAFPLLRALGSLFHVTMPDFLGFAFNIWEVSLTFDDLVDLVFLVAIGSVLLYRFMRVGREQARAAAELDAAREVQQRLVPVELPGVKGYALEAAYLPASEVGGDFYQVLVGRDDSTLIVVGDVSGKGLKAAMTGVLAIGAIRTLAAEGHGPAELLRRLNEQIVSAQHGGFITCICAKLEAGLDGDRLTLANAGHIPPYQNGIETVLESGLPLGVVADVQYEERVKTLVTSDRLTFLSDGVIEARSASGSLFGFERTAKISKQPAQSIADAAQAFGQDDDITVLTLVREG